MKIRLVTFSLVTLALLAALTGRAEFDPGPDPITGTETRPQRINSGTGTIDPGGILAVTGDNVAIRVTGTSTINNNGTIQQDSVLTGSDAGNSRGIRDNTGGLTLTINNGRDTNANALIQTASADCIQMKKSDTTVTLNNYGTINSRNSSAGGNQAIDWNDMTDDSAGGSNTLNNFSTGVITGFEADAVRPGVNGVVANFGTIKATTNTGGGSDGVDGQGNSGIMIRNNGKLMFAASRWGWFLRSKAGIIEGGRHGITAGSTEDGIVNVILRVTNEVFCTIRGDDGAGINIDGSDASEVVTICNLGWITGNGRTHDGDGVDVDGIVNLTNGPLGLIQSLNSASDEAVAASEGISAGGGTILNSGTIEGSLASGNTTAVGRGITIAGVDKDANGNSIPVQAPYAATTITNSGLIKGDSDSAIVFSSALASGFNHTITNQAGGTIEGGGNTAAAIQTGADNDTLNNAGDVIAGVSGKAIDLGDGNDALNITGGTIKGNISGGSGTNACTIDLGAGHSFTYTGSISNFNSVNIKSGHVSFSGSIGGDVTIGGGTATATLAPGAPGQQRATLIIHGTLRFIEKSIYTFRANGADRVIAGGVTIKGGAMTIPEQIGGGLLLGRALTVISNNAATPIHGTFANLADGSIITMQGRKLKANYSGGDGNDLTLTVVQ